MSFKSKFLMIVLSASLAMYSIAGAWLATRAQQPANDPNAQQKIFEAVLKHIQDDYVDEPNMDKVRAGALRGLAYGLDPYSTYLTANQVKEYSAGAKSNEVGIGVLRINSLDNGEAADAKAKLQDLMKQGAQKIVVDLRSVAGGEIQEGVTVANFFVRDGSIAKTIGREQKVLKSFDADPKVALFNGPAVVLIDSGTAGAAEVVASAFAETKRGDVVGEKSFGAGAEQELFTLRDGDGLLLTTVKWASGSGKPFLGEDRTHSGISPTVEVKRPENLEATDVEDPTGNEGDKPNQPKPSSPSEPVTKPQAEDIQLKKAIELLRDKPGAPAQ